MKSFGELYFRLYAIFRRGIKTDFNIKYQVVVSIVTISTLFFTATNTFAYSYDGNLILNVYGNESLTEFNLHSSGSVYFDTYGELNYSIPEVGDLILTGNNGVNISEILNINGALMINGGDVAINKAITSSNGFLSSGKTFNNTSDGTITAEGFSININHTEKVTVNGKLDSGNNGVVPGGDINIFGKGQGGEAGVEINSELTTLGGSGGMFTVVSALINAGATLMIGQGNVIIDGSGNDAFTIPELTSPGTPTMTLTAAGDLEIWGENNTPNIWSDAGAATVGLIGDEYIDINGDVLLRFLNPISSISIMADSNIYLGEYSATPVPEPATMFLLGSGLIGLAGARRKLRK